MRASITAVLAIMLAAWQSPSFAADQVSEGQWFHRFLNTEEAQRISRGAGVTVAVIDSGVDATHPDLEGSVLPGTDLTESGPGDGRIDSNGHGTKMASLIAAHGRVQGVAPAASILPVRAGSGDGVRGDRIAIGIRWAVAHGAKVISVSTGGDDDPLLRQEVQAALAADIVIVAAVGNRPGDDSVRYPAGSPGVVAVAAIGNSGDHSSTSVSGPQVVLSAPGDDISGAYPGGKHQIGSGTSNATALTAGAVALIRARFPNLRAADVVRRLTATAIDKGSPGRDPEYGFGVINLVGALTADVPLISETPSTTAVEGPGSGTAGPATPEGSSWRLVVIVLAGLVLLAAAVGLVVFARRRAGTS
jgi:type VII secretion-associated serine protease mycosin